MNTPSQTSPLVELADAGIAPALIQNGNDPTKGAKVELIEMADPESVQPAMIQNGNDPTKGTRQS